MCQGWNCQATDNKRRNCHYRGNEGFFSPFLDSPRPPSPLFCTCDSIATPFRLSPAAAPSKRDSDRQVAPGEGRGHTNKGRGERPVTSFFATGAITLLLPTTGCLPGQGGATEEPLLVAPFSPPFWVVSPLLFLPPSAPPLPWPLLHKRV